ncbi:MAG TPA: hypothetical protein VNH64_04270, partial [Parvularculaceae bacterium]|nr:hypothetical protein [Parvularculaceae bacterium]
FAPEEMLPAIGQGVVAVECPERAFKTLEYLAAIDDAPTRAEATAEREVLWVLNGHCNSPIAGRATAANGRLVLRAAVLSEDGAEMIEAEASGASDRPRELGRAVGMALIERGANALIEVSRAD